MTSLLLTLSTYAHLTDMIAQSRSSRDVSVYARNMCTKYGMFDVSLYNKLLSPCQLSAFNVGPTAYHSSL